MNDALATQQTQLYVVSRALINFKKTGKEKLTPASIRQRMTSLQNAWARFLQGHSALLQLCPESKRETIAYFQDKQLDAHDLMCQEALDYMAESLEELEPFVNPNKSLNSTFAQPEGSSFSLRHLPLIKLPPFSGRSDEWENFRDRFHSLIIDNKELSDFSRMHFLVASLTGGAREAIAHIKVTADNFTPAWKALKARYENKRRLIETHVAALYNLPTLTRESASELHALRDKAEQSVAALKGLDRSSEDIMNDMLVYFVSQKLDHATRRAWKLKVGESDKPPTFTELNRFLSSRALALEELNPHDSLKSSRGSKVTSATASVATEPACSLCTQQHFIFKCSQFTEKTPTQRREIVHQSRRCFNCLSANHSSKFCKSKFTCRYCQQKHHTLLHVDSQAPLQAAVATVASTSPEQTTEAPSVTSHQSISTAAVPALVVLSTARVTVRSPSGRALTVRALLDGGSELTFITERTAQILRLNRERAHTSISGLGCVDTEVCRSAALIHISPRDRPEPTFTTVAYILKSLTKYASRNAPSIVEWNHLANLKLADDDPTGSGSIDLIIGSDLYNRVLVNARHGQIGQPGAIQTHFGWVLSGTTSVPGHIAHTSHQMVAHHCSLE